MGMKFLKAIAEAYAGCPVFVDVAHRKTGWWGYVDYIGIYRLQLHNDVFTKYPEELGYVFMHEVGHIVHRHVAPKMNKTDISLVNIDDVIARAGEHAWFWRLAKSHMKEWEVEADAFAHRELPKVEALCRARGSTFLELALQEQI